MQIKTTKLKNHKLICKTFNKKLTASLADVKPEFSPPDVLAHGSKQKIIYKLIINYQLPPPSSSASWPPALRYLGQQSYFNK